MGLSLLTLNNHLLNMKVVVLFALCLQGWMTRKRASLSLALVWTSHTLGKALMVPGYFFERCASIYLEIEHDKTIYTCSEHKYTHTYMLHKIHLLRTKPQQPHVTDR